MKKSSSKIHKNGTLHESDITLQNGFFELI